MNLFLSVLICAAILTSVLTIGILILWFKGLYSIVLPGLGLIVTTPMIALMLLIVEIVMVLLGIFGRAMSVKA